MYAKDKKLRLGRVADVGCGTGAVTRLMAQSFSAFGVERVGAFDLHPAIDDLSGGQKVGFKRRDFASAKVATYDLAVLFDEIEHVPDQLGFLRTVGERSRLIALPTPMEEFILNGLRGEWRRKLAAPGHLVCLETFRRRFRRFPWLVSAPSIL